MANPPKAIDLYSGVGGLSLGMAKAGFNVIGAVEKEKRAIESHARNFPTSKHVCEDVSRLNGKSLSRLLKLKSTDLAGLVGGPPCQGFSTIGRRYLDDERNQLFINFFRLAAELRPAFFLVENVPGILNEQYSKLRNKAFKLTEEWYELLGPLKICANDFGAATTRTRIFFIGVRKDLKGAEKIPGVLESLKSSRKIFVKEAIAGLPMYISDEWLDFDSSWQRISPFTTNDYVKQTNLIFDGIGDSISINRFLKKKEVSGCFGTKHSKSVSTRFLKLKPGEQDKVSKAKRLKLDGFCPTLRAGTDNTKGSYQSVRPIHPFQARVITPREAARLQGFPDWFQFHETKWHSFRQIGNSVCPIVAEKVLSAIKTSLNI